MELFNQMLLEYRVSDIERTRKFYLDLGFEICYERPESKFVFMRMENNHIMIQQVSYKLGSWNTGELEYPFGRGVHPQMEVRDVDALYARVKKLKIPLFRELKTANYRQDDRMIHSKEFLIQDPDGYLLRFSTCTYDGMEYVDAETIDGKTKKVSKDDLHLSVHLYGVVVRDGKILISPQWKDNGYDFPGGRIDLGEDHIAGLIREVKEETGFVIKPTELIDVQTSFFYHPIKKKALHSLLIYYGGEIVLGEISTTGFDKDETSYAKEAMFVTLTELEKMQLMSNQKSLQKIIPYLEKRLK